MGPWACVRLLGGRNAYLPLLGCDGLQDSKELQSDPEPEAGPPCREPDTAHSSKQVLEQDLRPQSISRET